MIKDASAEGVAFDGCAVFVNAGEQGASQGLNALECLFFWSSEVVAEQVCRRRRRTLMMMILL